MLVVTGATGLLGNVLVRTLTSEAAGPVRVLARPTSDLSPLAGLDVEVVTGDVRDPASLVSAFAGADVVFHLAGIVSIARGGLRELRETNVEGTRNVLRACREAGVRRLVYCSSIHAFVVPPPGECLTEESPVDPGRSTGAYDRSKAEATLAVREAVEQGLDAVTVFPTGIIGPYDYRPSHTGELVIRCARGQMKAYVDGAYDFVDVRDVAAGMSAAAARGTAGAGYILAGHNVTVRELAPDDRRGDRYPGPPPAHAFPAGPGGQLPHPRLLLGHQAEAAVHHVLARCHIFGVHHDQREGRARIGLPSASVSADDGGHREVVAIRCCASYLDDRIAHALGRDRRERGAVHRLERAAQVHGVGAGVASAPGLWAAASCDPSIGFSRISMRRLRARPSGGVVGVDGSILTVGNGGEVFRVDAVLLEQAHHRRGARGRELPVRAPIARRSRSARCRYGPAPRPAAETWRAAPRPWRAAPRRTARASPSRNGTGCPAPGSAGGRRAAA